MKWLIRILALIILFILQLALANLNFGAAPNLLLLYLCVSLAAIRASELLWLILLAGSMLDMFSGLPDGIMVFAMFGGIGSAYYLGQVLAFERMGNFKLLLYAFLASIFFFLFNLSAQAIIYFFGAADIPAIGYLFTRNLWLSVVLNLLLLYPVFVFYQQQARIEVKYKIS